MSSLLTLRNVVSNQTQINTAGLTVNNTALALGTSAGATKTNFSNGSFAPASWQTAQSGLTASRQVQMSATGQYQLHVTASTVYLSSDTGATWTTLGATQGLPTPVSPAYWASGSISGSGDTIVLAMYTGSLWVSADFGRTFAVTKQATPDIWLPLNGSTTDLMGVSTITATGSPTYVTVQQPGYALQAINLVNTAGGTPSRYVRGTWSGAANFTVSFWFNAQTNTQGTIFSTYSNGLQIYLSSQGLYAAMNSSGSFANFAMTSFTISPNTWYYVTLIFQTNGLCSLYLNNTLIGSATNNGGLGTSSGLYSFGTQDNSTTYAFNGYIDDFRLYNSAVPYVPLPHLQPNLWFPFEGTTAELGAQSANAQGSTIYLPFEGAVTDSNGVSTVTASGAVTYVAANRAGYTGQAINLANTAGSTATQYVRGTWTGATNFTVSFWFNPQTLNNTFQYIVSAYQSFFAVVINTSNRLTAVVPSGGGSNYTNIGGESANLSTNTWYYVTIIFQTGGTCSLYMDNTLIGSVSNTSGVGSLTANVFEISGFDTTQASAFNGYIDDFRLSNYAINYNPVSIPTVFGSVSYVPGVVGQSALNLVNTAGGTATNFIQGTWPGAPNFTVSFWMNPQTINGTQQTMFSAYQSGVLMLIDGYGTVNALVFVFPSGGSTNTTGITAARLSPNTWYHVHAIFQTGGVCSLHLNGTLVNTVTNTSGYGSYISDVFRLGGYTGGAAFGYNGYIDDFRIYNAAIPFHQLFPSNYLRAAVSGSGQMVLASAQSGRLVQSADAGATWSSPGRLLGAAQSAIQPNVSGLSSNTWVQNGVTWTASASTTLNGTYVPYKAFNNATGDGWLSANGPNYTSGGATINGVTATTTVSAGVGTVTGEWIQLQSSVPLVAHSFALAIGPNAYPFTNTPKTYFIVGSNDGSTWFPLQSGNFTISALSTVSSSILINVTGTQAITNMTGTVATISYATSTNAYTYFRMIGTSIMNYGAQASTYMEIGELYLNFNSPNPGTTNLAGGALALSHTGQYALATVGNASGQVMPNQTGLASATWTQGGVGWTASASSIFNNSLLPEKVFSNSIIDTGWASAVGTYNATTGAYIGSNLTNIQGIGNIYGEWLQIRASIPLVLISYLYGIKYAVSQTPKTYYIVGSMDGSTWYPLQYAVNVSNPFTTIERLLSGYITVNLTGSQSITGHITTSVTTTSYSYSSNPYTYFRFITTNTYISSELVEIGELYLNFSNAAVITTTSGASWTALANSPFNENVLALSGSGQYAIGSSSVLPFSRLTMDNTNADSQGGLTPAAQPGSTAPPTYSSAIRMVGTHSAFFNQTAGSTTPSVVLNYTVPSFLNTPSTLTMSCWMYPTSLPTGGNTAIPVGFNNNGTQPGFLFQMNNLGVMYLTAWSTLGSNPSVLSTSSLPLNTWYHLVGTFSPGIITLYINGVLQGTAPISGNLAANGSISMTNLYVGAGYNTWGSFAGYVDDVRLYTSALNASQIASLYNNPTLDTQAISIASNYLSSNAIATNATFPSITAPVVAAATSFNGQQMVAVTSDGDAPLTRLTLDNTNVDARGGVTPATGAGTVTYSSSIVKVGTHSAFFNNTAGTIAANYLNYTVPAALNQPSALTMACWVYPTAYTGSEARVWFMSLSEASPSYLAMLGMETGGVLQAVVANNGTFVSSNVVAPLNAWSHIAMTFSGNRVSVYVNGIFYNSATIVGSLGTTNATNLYIGNSNPTALRAYQGYVDDVRIYTSALTPAQIQSIYSLNTINNVYYSTNYGGSFTGLSLGNSPMVGCAMSSDGSYFTVTNATTTYTLNTNSSGFALAVGNQAGQINQARHAIAIGNQAGVRNQTASSIVINATGSTVNATQRGFYVAPIAQASSSAAGSLALLGYGADQQVVQHTGFFINSGSGNVGIGTAPIGYTNDYRLKIEQGVNNNSNGLFLSNSNYGSMQGLNISMINSGLNNFYSYAAIQGYTSGVSATTNLSLQPTGGYVGIGTVSPLGLLHVHSNATSGAVTSLVLSNGIVNNTLYNIYIGMSGATNGGVTGSVAGDCVFRNDAGGFRFGYSTSAYMSITTAGNVGIGITNPSATLHVNGTILGSIFATINTSVNPQLSQNTYTLTVPYPGSYLFTVMSTGVNVNNAPADPYAKAIIYVLISPTGNLTTSVVISVGVSVDTYTTGTQALTYRIGTTAYGPIQTVNGGGTANVSIMRLA